MLVLARKVGEVIVINDDIKVTVLGIKGGVASLGIEAPDEIEIWRKEIWDTHQEDDNDIGNR
jgi:carbon storage regulator